MIKEIINKLGKSLLVINTSLFIISFSFAFIILFRPFYYYHIDYLNLVEKTGYSYETIKEAYDDVIDYIVYDKNFSMGELYYSASGKSHFKDCKKLFIIDFIILWISTIIIIFKKLFFNNIKVFKHSIEFISGVVNISLIVLLLVSSFIIGFDKIFIIFHSLFFAGKNNWLFNPRYDPIINILPEEFFMNCSILILSIIIIFSIICIIIDLYKNKKQV